MEWMTMIAIVIAGQPGGEQSDVSLIAASYSLGFMASCFMAPAQAFRRAIPATVYLIRFRTDRIVR
jgi:hypothetical protein